jgi:hypothetical protein
MRTLLIAALAAILAGCSCYAPPQADLAACRQTSGYYFCFDGATDTTLVELEPTPIKAHPAKKEMKAANAKGKSLVPAMIDDRVATETARSSVAKTEAPASQAIERSDPASTKARTTIAAKMEDPASAEFKEMKRAMRKNTFGKPVDTICGHVKGKNASGGDTGERPFLYLVKEDEAYVVDGSDSAAASVYRNICD